jgi:hypothetical protein
MTDDQFNQTIELLKSIKRSIADIENNTSNLDEIVKLLKEIKEPKKA